MSDRIYVRVVGTNEYASIERLQVASFDNCRLVEVSEPEWLAATEGMTPYLECLVKKALHRKGVRLRCDLTLRT